MNRRTALVLLLSLVFSAHGALAVAQGLPRGEAEALGFDPAKLEKIEGRLKEALEAGRIAGGSVLIARKGEVATLAVVGQADREADRAMAEDTIVRIASMSKPITSAAVLALVDQGKLKLDDPLSKFIPEFESMKVLTDESPYVVEAKKPITIRHLLTHTSGLSYRFLNKPIVGELYIAQAISDGLSETPGTIGQNCERLASIPLLFEPGTAWDYSLATDVLGRVVEVVTEKTLDAAFRDLIFEPLKMDDTAFLVPEEDRKRLAAVYEPGEDGKVKRLDRHPAQKDGLIYSATYPTWDDGRYYSGGAGLVSTLGDYARFVQMLLNDGELDGSRVLKSETVEAMTRDQLGDLEVPDWGHGQRFGYGVGVESRDSDGPGPASGSFSWGGFFSTYFWADPKNEIVGIVFTQAHPSGDPKLSDDIKRLTYEALSESN